ncbi:TonB-dependent receptor [Acidihalobacter aeolianus]|uniref:TonB-dependent receptor n=1 Tax=Acidihalobacter aeolianus TaxID=2792603 RepID=UPI0009F33EF6|nr:TonB-dependent receptor [Acidihalobacter aeolianus]
MKSAFSHASAVALLGVLGIAGSLLPGMAQAADTSDNGKTASTDAKTIKIKKVTKSYEKLIAAERNIPSVVNAVPEDSIKHASNASSIYSLLNETPSVNEYQQNIGPNTPVLVVRGVRMSQLAQTLDGIPLQDILYGGQGPFLSFNVGNSVSTGEIQSINVYPGVAPPSREGFATVGGTIAYTTRKPTAKPYAEFSTKIGSFGTNEISTDLNTGSIGGGMDGTRALFYYGHESSDGYILHTPSTYDNFMLSLLKPYDEGMSQVSAVLLASRGKSVVQTAPTPTAWLQEYGLYYNPPSSDTYSEQINKYYALILGDRTYINSHLMFQGHMFDIYRTGYFNSWTNPKYINASYPYQVNFQAPYFGYGPMGQANGIYNPNHFTYDPAAVFGTAQAGEAAVVGNNANNTFGIKGSTLLLLPHNAVKVGLMGVRERGWGSQYVYGNLQMPQINGYNSMSDNSAYALRSVYSGYIQDKITLMGGKLHIEPGYTYSGVNTVVDQPWSIYDTTGTAPPYILNSWYTVSTPYLGLAYDLRKDLIAYASYGKGARYSPASDLGYGNQGQAVAPAPEIVNMYEAGLRYDTARAYANFDVYLQEQKDMFSFYINYTTGAAQYQNVGKERMQGAELSGAYKLTPAVELTANTSYTEARYVNGFWALMTPFEGQYGYAFAGDHVPFVPAWTGNLGIKYDKNGTYVKLSTHYTGRMHYVYTLGPNETQTYQGIGLADATVSSPNTFGGFWIFDLKASQKLPVHMGYLKDVKLTLNVDNLFDKKYYSHFYNIYKEYDFAAVGTPYDAAYPGMPRYISLGLSAKFS